MSPTEITHIIFDATQVTLQTMGITQNGQARLCRVYEGAESLIPEFTAIVALGDKAATNGTARAILQGRKYGLGCLLVVTQRTANVTKTILNQCNTVFAIRTFDDTGKEFLSNYLGQSYAEKLKSPPTRHAVFFGKASVCDNPVHIELNDRNEFITAFRNFTPPPTRSTK